ncbi:uncharacterized protein [Nicotiana tomentosiformis]|uniref:uncharacterized protein n=1 Tax=Nicotiana tomentosiformis TaxID=4098 RepID=UPI00388CC6C5
MTRGRPKRNATTIPLMDYTGTGNNTQITGTQSSEITDVKKISKEQWPPLSAIKEGMQTPPAMSPLPMIDSAKVTTGNQWENVNASSGKVGLHARNSEANTEDRDEVLYSGPHMLNNKPIIMKLDRITYAKVLIEMDITKELPRAIKVTHPKGREFMQEIVYDWVPEFCHTCMQVGHICKKEEQPTQKIKPKQQKQKQEWQPKANLSNKVEQENVPVKNSEVAMVAGANSNIANPPTRIARGEEEHIWKKATGKSVARSKKKTGADEISMINGFNILVESGLQLTVPRQMGEGSIYGLHTLEDRRYLWRDLADINIRQQGPWLIMGDYNAIRSEEDRLIGNLVQELEVRDFNSFIDDTALVEMRTNGRNFTWTNGHTYSKIDRALVNTEWMLKMPYLEVWVMDLGCSDHSPLNVSFEDNEEKVPKPFKFLNHLVEHKDFLALVSGAWQESNEDNTMKDEQMRSPGQPENMVIVEKDIKMQLEKWLRNKIKNLIRSNEEVIQTKQEIEEKVIGFYKQLLGSATGRLPAINLVIMRDGPLVNRQQQLQLVKAISKEEIYKALLGISDSKAPGCDGFNALFFKKAWPVVGDKITDAVMEFF